MKQRTRQSQSSDPLMDFEAHELQATMHEFLEDEKDSNTNIWNFSTIAGIAMFFIAIVFIIQSIGLTIGPDVSGIVEVLPLVGGVIITLIGFGFIAGDKKIKKKQKKSPSKYKYDYDFDKEEDSKNEDYTLNNDLGDKDKSKNRSTASSDKADFDNYAFRRVKKLYKSRTDKKIAGVCGGLAKYFGISAAVIRVLFIITLFAGGGTSLLIYLALALVLDKEPPEMMDDFDF